MTWALKNMGLVVGGFMILFAAFAVTTSLDRWTDQLKLNSTKVAEMDTCRIQMADMMGRVMKK